jgi:diaminopimelate epimerase
VRLVKAHAYGNDFLLAAWDDAHARAQGDLAQLARAVCARHTGIGADGLMLVAPTENGAATQLYNADGSPSEISGNGIRCVAAWLARRNRLGPGADVVIATGAGDRPITILERQGRQVICRADMGPVTELHQVSLDVEGTPVTCVTMRVGNPQCVVLGGAADLTTERLHRIAGRLAVHPHFPHGTNVELACLETSGRVRILIWERGVGPTEASGTGACAAAAAAHLVGGADASLDVDAPGGVQHVDVTAERLWLTGAAEVIAHVEWVDGAPTEEET